MSRKIITAFFLATVLFCSCDRKYSCTCDNGLTYNIDETRKGPAKDACDAHDSKCPDGKKCPTKWNCELL